MASPGAKGPLTAAEKRRIEQLHAQGLGRNAVARDIGRAVSTVSTYCAKVGLTFDRSRTRVAVASAKADAALLRTELELQLLHDAQRLRGQIWQEHTYIDHGGKDYERVEWTQSEPSPLDKKNLMQAAGMAIDRSIRLAETGKDGEVDQARTMLGQLLVQLRVVSGDYDPAIAQ